MSLLITSVNNVQEIRWSARIYIILLSLRAKCYSKIGAAAPRNGLGDPNADDAVSQDMHRVDFSFFSMLTILPERSVRA